MNFIEMELRGIQMAHEKCRGVAKRRFAAIVLGAALAFFSGGAAAIWPTQEVGMNLYQSIMNQINTLKTQYSTELAQVQQYAEYAKELDRWMQRLANWQQKLAAFNQIISNPSLPNMEPLTRVDEDYGVKQKCGADSLLSLSGIMNALGLSLNGDMIANQRQICRAIRRAQNAKYNATVDFINVTMPQISYDLGTIAEIRTLLKTEGTMAESTNNATQSAVRIDAAFTQFDTEMKLYDQTISSLELRQQMITQMALKGEDSVLGTMVKTATLKAALSL